MDRSRALSDSLRNRISYAAPLYRGEILPCTKHGEWSREYGRHNLFNHGTSTNYKYGEQRLASHTSVQKALRSILVWLSSWQKEGGQSGNGHFSVLPKKKKKKKKKKGDDGENYGVHACTKWRVVPNYSVTNQNTQSKIKQAEKTCYYSLAS